MVRSASNKDLRSAHVPRAAVASSSFTSTWSVTYTPRPRMAKWHCTTQMVSGCFATAICLPETLMGSCSIAGCRSTAPRSSFMSMTLARATR